MKLLTLTPEHEAYLVALVTVAALACAPGAALVCVLWRTRLRPGFLTVYSGLLTAVAALGVATLTLPSVTQGSADALVSSALLGLPAGVCASSCDEWIRRALRRRTRRAASERGLRTRSSVPLLASVSRVPPPGAGTAAPDVGGPLALLLLIAGLEELLFRGILVDLALHLSFVVAAVCIAASVVVFAASHVYWGLEEFVAKLPLGLAALAVSLPFRAVVGAVVAHMVFNARSWLASRGGAAEFGLA